MLPEKLMDAPPNETPATVLADAEVKISRKITRKKRFHFSLTSNQIFPIPHIDDLSDEEVKDTWYERADYEKMKMSMIPLIRKIMKGETVEENDRQTIRGLEFRTRQGAIRRQHNKVEAITAVLEEQERQLEFAGYVDDELLASVYNHISNHCQEEAHELALGDVDFAIEYLSDVSGAVRSPADHLSLDDPRKTPERKTSFGQLFRQMRIRRRPTLAPESDDRPPVLPAGRPITGSAA